MVAGRAHKKGNRPGVEVDFERGCYRHTCWDEECRLTLAAQTSSGWLGWLRLPAPVAESLRGPAAPVPSPPPPAWVRSDLEATRCAAAAAAA